MSRRWRWGWSRFGGWGVVFVALLLSLPVPTRAAPAASAARVAPGELAVGQPSAASVASGESPALATAGAAPAPQALTPVRVGIQFIVPDAGLLVSHDWGYFRELGFDAQLSRMDNVELQTAMASGNADVGGTGPTAALLNAFLRGIRLKIVADRGTLAPGHGYAALVVRQDLVDSGQVRGMGDLRGRRIGGQPPLHATQGWYLASRLLERGGLTEADVEYVPLGFADQNAGLAGRTIDAALQPEPGVTAVVDQGLAVRMIGLEEAIGNFALAGMAYSEQFAAQTDTARRFMVGYLRGVRAYLDAFTRNQGRPEVVEVLARHTAVKDHAVYDRMQMPYMNPDGAFNTYGYDDAQRYFIRRGVLPQMVVMAQIVDNSFADYAAQQLGPYR